MPSLRKRAKLGGSGSMVSTRILTLFLILVVATTLIGCAKHNKEEKQTTIQIDKGTELTYWCNKLAKSLRFDSEMFG